MCWKGSRPMKTSVVIQDDWNLEICKYWIFGMLWFISRTFKEWPPAKSLIKKTVCAVSYLSVSLAWHRKQEETRSLSFDIHFDEIWTYYPKCFQRCAIPEKSITLLKVMSPQFLMKRRWQQMIHQRARSKVKRWRDTHYLTVHHCCPHVSLYSTNGKVAVININEKHSAQL